MRNNSYSKKNGGKAILSENNSNQNKPMGRLTTVIIKKTRLSECSSQNTYTQKQHSAKSRRKEERKRK
jgi:hypothetical protein